MPKGEKKLPAARPNPCELALGKAVDELDNAVENGGDAGGDERKRGGGDIE